MWRQWPFLQHTTLSLYLSVYTYQIQEKKLCYFVFILLLICATRYLDTNSTKKSPPLPFLGYIDHSAINTKKLPSSTLAAYFKK